MEIKRPTRWNRWFFIAKTYCSLDMFQAPLCPSSGAREYYTGGCSLQLHTRPTTCKPKHHRLQPPVYYSWAPDDGHNGARNMSSEQ